VANRLKGLKSIVTNVEGRASSGACKEKLKKGEEGNSSNL